MCMCDEPTDLKQKIRLGSKRHEAVFPVRSLGGAIVQTVFTIPKHRRRKAYGVTEVNYFDTTSSF